MTRRRAGPLGRGAVGRSHRWGVGVCDRATGPRDAIDDDGPYGRPTGRWWPSHPDRRRAGVVVRIGILPTIRTKDL